MTRTPTTARDSLDSRQYAELIDLSVKVKLQA
jgi:hypothetical protein